MSVPNKLLEQLRKEKQEGKTSDPYESGLPKLNSRWRIISATREPGGVLLEMENANDPTIKRRLRPGRRLTRDLGRVCENDTRKAPGLILTYTDRRYGKCYARQWEVER